MKLDHLQEENIFGNVLLCLWVPMSPGVRVFAMSILADSITGSGSANMAAVAPVRVVVMSYILYFVRVFATDAMKY